MISKILTLYSIGQQNPVHVDRALIMVTVYSQLLNSIKKWHDQVGHKIIIARNPNLTGWIPQWIFPFTLSSHIHIDSQIHVSLYLPTLECLIKIESLSITISLFLLFIFTNQYTLLKYKLTTFNRWNFR